MREGIHILSNKAVALHRVETFRVLDVQRFDRLWNTGIASPYSETKRQVGKDGSLRKRIYLETEQNAWLGV